MGDGAMTAYSDLPAAGGSLALGDTAPAMEWHITQADIDRYAEATGDHNPIHVDPDYAAKGPFGRTIAHGLMTLAFAAQMLNRWTGGAFDEAGEIDVSFTGPVFVEDRIRIGAEVTGIDDEGIATCALSCTAGDRQILAGTVRLPVEEKGETLGA